MSPDSVLTLEDIASWSFQGTALAVLGHPIGHSLSPVMQNAALMELARRDSRFADWRYFRFDIPVEDLPRALELLHQKRFRGVNLTVPHKIVAFGQVAKVDEQARPFGAVNTLQWEEGGWHGFNTDGYGFAMAVRETLGLDLAGANVVLLGAGGAARAVAAECLARGCAALQVANRSRENLDGLLEILRPLAGNIPVAVFVPQNTPRPVGRPPQEGSSVAAACESPLERGARRVGCVSDALVVNATSAGLKAEDPSPLDLASIPRPRGVIDLIYSPPQTRLLRQAEELGVPAANGLAMLVHQGAKSLEIWSGIPAERTAPVMTAALARRFSAPPGADYIGRQPTSQPPQ